ncbi:MAG: ATP-binding protein [bacterium]
MGKDKLFKASKILHDKFYRELMGKNILRLALTYLAPLILLAFYFHFQYQANYRASRQLHLKSLADYQANTLDLFLRERVVNLSNLIDDPRFQCPPSSSTMESYLKKLKMNSDIFVDVGFFDSSGVQMAYAGPLHYLENRDYSQEPWYKTLKESAENYITTDIYLGFRQKPHFTIGVKRIISNQYIVLRATLDPEKFYEYITTLESQEEVNSSLVNQKGYYQVVTPTVGNPLQASAIIPPMSPRLGVEIVQLENANVEYAYAWLRSAKWAVIVQWENRGGGAPPLTSRLGIPAFALAVILVVLSIIVIRAKRLVELQIEKETVKAQLEHAAKLASVGELSAGIAHEINNPLAIISEEIGLMRDLMNPEFGEPVTYEELFPHMDNIHEAVFRCRDITRKLLSFVRKTDIKITPHDVNTLMEEIVDAFWIREMAVSNIEILKDYQPDIPKIVTDGNQLKQVFLNFLTNAVDAITPPGRITITTFSDQDNIYVTISDSGCGITQEQMERIFLPFYTTKEVGKGTGLGLSVSYGIVKSLGGKILVESIPGKGSTFTVVLPHK